MEMSGNKRRVIMNSSTRNYQQFQEQKNPGCFMNRNFSCNDEPSGSMRGNNSNRGFPSNIRQFNDNWDNAQSIQSPLQRTLQEPMYRRQHQGNYHKVISDSTINSQGNGNSYKNVQCRTKNNKNGWTHPVRVQCSGYWNNEPNFQKYPSEGNHHAKNYQGSPVDVQCSRNWETAHHVQYSKDCDQPSASNSQHLQGNMRQNFIPEFSKSRYSSSNRDQHIDNQKTIHTRIGRQSGTQRGFSANRGQSSRNMAYFNQKPSSNESPKPQKHVMLNHSIHIKNKRPALLATPNIQDNADLSTFTIRTTSTSKKDEPSISVLPIVAQQPQANENQVNDMIAADGNTSTSKDNILLCDGKSKGATSKPTAPERPKANAEPKATARLKINQELDAKKKGCCILVKPGKLIEKEIVCPVSDQKVSPTLKPVAKISSECTKVSHPIRNIEAKTKPDAQNPISDVKRQPENDRHAEASNKPERSLLAERQKEAKLSSQHTSTAQHHTVYNKSDEKPKLGVKKPPDEKVGIAGNEDFKAQQQLVEGQKNPCTKLQNDSGKQMNINMHTSVKKQQLENKQDRELNSLAYQSCKPREGSIGDKNAPDSKLEKTKAVVVTTNIRTSYDNQSFNVKPASSTDSKSLTVIGSKRKNLSAEGSLQSVKKQAVENKEISVDDKPEEAPGKNNNSSLEVKYVDLRKNDKKTPKKYPQELKLPLTQKMQIKTNNSSQSRLPVAQHAVHPQSLTPAAALQISYPSESYPGPAYPPSNMNYFTPPGVFSGAKLPVPAPPQLHTAPLLYQEPSHHYPSPPPPHHTVPSVAMTTPSGSQTVEYVNPYRCLVTPQFPILNVPVDTSVYVAAMSKAAEIDIATQPRLETSSEFVRNNQDPSNVSSREQTPIPNKGIVGESIEKPDPSDKIVKEKTPRNPKPHTNLEEIFKLIDQIHDSDLLRSSSSIVKEIIRVLPLRRKASISWFDKEAILYAVDRLGQHFEDHIRIQIRRNVLRYGFQAINPKFVPDVSNTRCDISDDEFANEHRVSKLGDDSDSETDLENSKRLVDGKYYSCWISRQNCRVVLMQRLSVKAKNSKGEPTAFRGFKWGHPSLSADLHTAFVVRPQHRGIFYQWLNKSIPCKPPTRVHRAKPGDKDYVIMKVNLSKPMSGLKGLPQNLCECEFWEFNGNNKRCSVSSQYPKGMSKVIAFLAENHPLQPVTFEKSKLRQVIIDCD